MTATATAIAAENVIRRMIDTTQARLDREASEARTAHQTALRSRALEGVNPDSDLYPIASLVSQTVTVGREDGYPLVAVPAETKKIIERAQSAGMLEHPARIGALVWSTSINEIQEWSRDYEAWSAAKEYREKNR